MILCISLLGDPDILILVLVCLASVCIIIRILRQCFIVVRFLSVTSRFTSIAYVSCKCSPKCIILTAFIIRPQIPSLISSSQDDLKSCTPNLSMTPPKNSEMTYTVSSGTLNSSIPYHTIPEKLKNILGYRPLDTLIDAVSCE